MSEFKKVKPIILHPQPDFPSEDLHTENIPMIEFYLQERHEPLSHAEYLKGTLRQLHLTAHHALESTGISLKYSQKEYEAFCEGFATFEYMSLMVNPRHIREQLVVRNVHNLLTRTGVVPELELADRRDAWVDMFPNVYGVVSETGYRKDETMEQIVSRTAGAQVAHELQMSD